MEVPHLGGQGGLGLDATRTAYEMAKGGRGEDVARDVSFDEDSFRGLVLADTMTDWQWFRRHSGARRCVCLAIEKG
jgi:hypothetical protein